MPIGPARMPLFDHIGELRRRLTIIVVSLLVCAIVVYFATPALIELMMDQIREAMRGGDLYVFTALGGFTIRFQVALFFSVIICAPIIIWEVVRASSCRRSSPTSASGSLAPTVAAMVVLFFLGMIFCYFVIQSAAFGWLLDQSFEFAQNLANAEDYLNIYMMLEIGFGIAFQLPLVIFYLSILHVVPYKTFRSQWRYVYVALMLLSAVVTPDASPITMLLMFAALIALYEVALAVARYIIIARDGKAALKWSRADYEQHALDND